MQMDRMVVLHFGLRLDCVERCAFRISRKIRQSAWKVIDYFQKQFCLPCNKDRSAKHGRNFGALNRLSKRRTSLWLNFG